MTHYFEDINSCYNGNDTRQSCLLNSSAEHTAVINSIEITQLENIEMWLKLRS